MNILKEYKFSYRQFDNDSLLNSEDHLLLSKARKTTELAYAPYSKFFVGAAALLANKEIITASNQENASSPAGICAERVLLSAVTALYGETEINTIAISYKKNHGKSDHPITPCGICRQSLIEFESRMNNPIRLILSGMEGKVIMIDSASFLLPLNFNSSDLI
jgi:cytidine deaminase